MRKYTLLALATGLLTLAPISRGNETFYKSLGGKSAITAVGIKSRPGPTPCVLFPQARRAVWTTDPRPARRFLGASFFLTKL
jgi:hypothetical protein